MVDHSKAARTRKIVEDFVFCLFRGEKMMPVLHFLPPSPPCRSVLLLGRMLNIEFELQVVNVLEGDQLKPEYIELNPQHTIPTLEDHGLVLCESRVILSYLAAAYTKDDTLYPRDVRARALVDQKIHFDLGALYARMGDYFFPVLFMGAPFDEKKKAKLDEALEFLEAMLKGRTWVAVNQFTIADLTLTVTVSQIEAFDFDLEPYIRIKTWLQRCKDFLAPHGYDEINQQGADTLAAMLRSKVKT